MVGVVACSKLLHCSVTVKNTSPSLASYVHMIVYHI